MDDRTRSETRRDEFRGFLDLVEFMSFFDDVIRGALTPRPPHAHRCECGIEWEHDTADVKSDEEYKRAHACSGCGREVLRVHHYLDPEFNKKVFKE